MSELDHSIFLKRVLDAVRLRGCGISVDPGGEPDPIDVAMIAEMLNEGFDDVTQALKGLRAGDCLMEEVAEFEGIETLMWWRVHPQCSS